jgi:hypothetical protein
VQSKSVKSALYVFSRAMLMSSSIKSVSTTQIQDAIAKALSELTGKICSVSISLLQFGEVGGESLTLSANAWLQLPESGEPLPF